MPTQREKIIAQASQVLERAQEGIRYSALVKRVQQKLPGVTFDKLRWEVWWWLKRDKSIARPERGIYIFKKYLKEGWERKIRQSKARRRLADETLFYQPFADFLVQDLAECTIAKPLGGNRFGDKWGTPDVLGTYKVSSIESINPPVEIVSAEIKVDPNQLIAAFGQACSYKLFSHKVYLVIPKIAEKDVERVESLCLKFGIGLVLFDSNKPNDPKFEIRTRALKVEPDYFYVHKYFESLDKNFKKDLL